MDLGRSADGIEFPALRGWCVRLKSGNGEGSKKSLWRGTAVDSAASTRGCSPSDTLRECFLLLASNRPARLLLEPAQGTGKHAVRTHAWTRTGAVARLRTRAAPSPLRRPLQTLQKETHVSTKKAPLISPAPSQVTTCQELVPARELVWPEKRK